MNEEQQSAAVMPTEGQNGDGAELDWNAIDYDEFLYYLYDNHKDRAYVLPTYEWGELVKIFYTFVGARCPSLDTRRTRSSLTKKLQNGLSKGKVYQELNKMGDNGEKVGVLFTEKKQPTGKDGKRKTVRLIHFYANEIARLRSVKSSPPSEDNVWVLKEKMCALETENAALRAEIVALRNNDIVNRGMVALVVEHCQRQQMEVDKRLKGMSGKFYHDLHETLRNMTEPARKKARIDLAANS